MDQRDLFEGSINLTSQQTKTNEVYIPSMQSGASFLPMKLGLVDNYGQIVSSDNSSILYVQPNMAFETSDQAKEFPPIVEGLNTFQAQAGIFTIEDFTFYATPAFNHSIVITTSAIDLLKDSSVRLMKKLNSTDLDLKVIISLNECYMGQQFTPSGKCIDCIAPTFSFSKFSQPGNCQQCPERAICLGLNNIGPKPGYWRPSNTSTQFYKCLRKESCLGYHSVLDDPLGNCSLGYQGILCADCAQNYYKSKSNTCLPCDNKITQLCLLFGSVLGWILMIYLIVIFQQRQLQNPLFHGALYLKTLLNHFQLLLITWSIDFFATEDIKVLSERIISAATISSYFLELDCFVQEDSLQNISSQMTRLSSFKVFISLLIPIGMIVVCSAIYFTLKLFSVKASSSIFKTSITCGFHVVYPAVIYKIYQFVTYRTINGEGRLLIDLEISQGSEEHHFVLLYFGFPSLLIWGIGVPLLGLYLLHRTYSKEWIGKSQAYSEYLFGGYARRKFYWEIVITFRKLSLLTIIVISYQLGSVVQTLLVQTVYVLSLIVNTSLSPFKRKEYLYMENYSITVQILTLYLGLYLQVDVPRSWQLENVQNADFGLVLEQKTSITFSYLIMIVNASYFVFWIFFFLRSLKFFYQSKFTRVYLCVAQCCRVNSLKMPRLSALIEKQYLIDLENEDQAHRNHLEEYYTLIRRINSLYTSQGIRISTMGIMQLQNYLSMKKIKKQLQRKLQESRIQHNTEEQSQNKDKTSTAQAIQDLRNKRHSSAEPAAFEKQLQANPQDQKYLRQQKRYRMKNFE